MAQQQEMSQKEFVAKHTVHYGGGKVAKPGTVIPAGSLTEEDVKFLLSEEAIAAKAANTQTAAKVNRASVRTSVDGPRAKITETVPAVQSAPEVAGNDTSDLEEAFAGAPGSSEDNGGFNEE